jgi:hypothetical protein
MSKKVAPIPLEKVAVTAEIDNKKDPAPALDDHEPRFLAIEEAVSDLKTSMAKLESNLKTEMRTSMARLEDLILSSLHKSDASDSRKTMEVPLDVPNIDDPDINVDLSTSFSRKPPCLPSNPSISNPPFDLLPLSRRYQFDTPDQLAPTYHTAFQDTDRNLEDCFDAIPPETSPREIWPPRKARDVFLPPPIAPSEILANNFTIPPPRTILPPREAKMDAGFARILAIISCKDTDQTTSKETKNLDADSVDHIPPVSNINSDDISSMQQVVSSCMPSFARRLQETNLPPPVVSSEMRGNDFSTPSTSPDIGKPQYYPLNFKRIDHLHATRGTQSTSSFFVVWNQAQTLVSLRKFFNPGIIFT